MVRGMAEKVFGENAIYIGAEVFGYLGLDDEALAFF